LLKLKYSLQLQLLAFIINKSKPHNGRDPAKCSCLPYTVGNSKQFSLQTTFKSAEMDWWC